MSAARHLHGWCLVATERGHVCMRCTLMLFFPCSSSYWMVFNPASMLWAMSRASEYWQSKAIAKVRSMQAFMCGWWSHEVVMPCFPCTRLLAFITPSMSGKCT